jgi:hypothetical protein
VTDLSQTIAPKSTQLNADDLIGGPRTILVTKVARSTEPDQPIAINFEGDGGKPYLPCKSMRRVLVTVWGNDGNAYVGRSMTLYRDDKVLFGGIAVGGIRISHMTGLEREMTLALTVTKARRAPYVVKPLRVEQPAAPRRTKADLFADARAKAREGSFALEEWRAALPDRARAALDEIAGDLTAIAEAADAEADSTGDTGRQPEQETV